MSGDDESKARFKTSMDGSINYPQNLIRTSHFNHTLKAYTRKIHSLEGDLFHSHKRLVWITELPNDTDEFVEHGKVKTQELLQSALNEGVVDPRCRYIFLQSDSTRGPLGCTKAELGRILTHHQVSPSFLDILLTFRKCHTPSLFTMFRHEHHLSDEKEEHRIPSLGRSGVQLEHSFNLVSVERSDKVEPVPWYIRRTGAYNSFDLVENRAVWIVLKGDRLMRDRINSASKAHRLMKGSALQTREGTLRAILAMHLLIMEWSVENWHSYIDYLVEEAMQDTDIAGTAPLDQAATEEPAMVQNIISAPTSRRGTFNSQTSSLSLGQRISSAFFQKRDSGFSSTALDKIPSGQQAPGIQQTQSWGVASAQNGQVDGSTLMPQSYLFAQFPTEPNPEYEYLEKVFRFEAVQDLSIIRRQMAEAVLAIEQNRSIFEEIRQYYADLQKLEDFKANVDMEASRSAISNFFSQIRSLDSELEKALGRLKIQLSCLDSELQLRYGALQFRSAKWSGHFAASSLLSAKEMTNWTEKMHTIAEKTEQETVSMHFITVLTLIFLPGTFLAVRFGAPALEHFSQMALTCSCQTFFSSGIFNWNDQAPIDSDYQLRGSGLALFAEIGLPLTAVVMLFWIAVYKGYWRKHRERLSDEEKAQC